MTSSLAASLTSAGFNLQNASWFDTLCVEVDDAAQVIQAAELAGLISAKSRQPYRSLTRRDNDGRGTSLNLSGFWR